MAFFPCNSKLSLVQNRFHIFSNLFSNDKGSDNLNSFFLEETSDDDDSKFIFIYFMYLLFYQMSYFKAWLPPSFFSIRVLLHGHWWLTGQQGVVGDHLLFHSTTSTHSLIVKHTFATLHVRWLSCISNCMLVFTRLRLDEIYDLIELPFHSLMMWCWC